MSNISDLKLERFALGELPVAEQQALEGLLKNDPLLRERLQALRASNAAILGETSPVVFANRLRALERRRAVEASVTHPARTASNTFGVWKPVLGSLALVLPLLAILVLPNAVRGPRPTSEVTETTVRTSPAVNMFESVKQGEPTSTSTPPLQQESPTASSAETSPTELASTLAADDGVRLKGLEPHLAIFRKTDSGSEPLYPGEKARSGELLRIGYQSAGFTYGAILSVDGNGNVTRHWPISGQRAGRLENGEALLPSSFELDAAPDFERFYFVVSKRSFDLGPLLQSLREHETLPDLKKLKAIKETESRIVRFEVLKESGI